MALVDLILKLCVSGSLRGFSFCRALCERGYRILSIPRRNDVVSRLTGGNFQEMKEK